MIEAIHALEDAIFALQVASVVAWGVAWLAMGFWPTVKVTDYALKIDGFASWSDARQVMGISIYVFFFFLLVLWPLALLVCIPTMWLMDRYDRWKGVK